MFGCHYAAHYRQRLCVRVRAACMRARVRACVRVHASERVRASVCSVCAFVCLCVACCCTEAGVCGAGLRRWFGVLG